MWETARYTCVAEKSAVFTSAVESLAFLSGSNEWMIAVDSLGNTLSFTLAKEGLRAHLKGRLVLPSGESIAAEMVAERSSFGNPTEYSFENISERRITQLSEDGSTAAVSVVAWAAQGETFFIKIWHIVYKRVQSGWNRLLFHMYQFVRERLHLPEHFTVHNHLSLSYDGSSLIALGSVLPDSVVRLDDSDVGLLNAFSRSYILELDVILAAKYSTAPKERMQPGERWENTSSFGHSTTTPGSRFTRRHSCLALQMTRLRLRRRRSVWASRAWKFKHLTMLPPAAIWTLWFMRFWNLERLEFFDGMSQTIASCRMWT